MRLQRGYVIGVIVLAACGGDSTTPKDFSKVPLAASIVAGDSQADSIGATLASPVTVLVATVDGAQPATGVVVNFVVTTDGCGKAFAGSAATDGAGRAADRWILGTKAGVCTMEVRTVDSDGTPHVLSSAKATITTGNPTNADVQFVGSDSLLVAGWNAFPFMNDRAGNRVNWAPDSVAGPFVVRTYALPQNLPSNSYLIPTTVPGVGSISGKTPTGFKISSVVWSCVGDQGRPLIRAAAQVKPC